MKRPFDMEKSVAAEESRQQSDSANLVDKSSGSLVEIDNIYLDLPFAVTKEETEKFSHFSLRGYVAEMREKNKRICAPFASEDTNENDLEEQLPPLIVPKYRYWRCKHCISDICSQNPSKGGRKVSKSCQHRLLSDHTGVNMPAEENATVTPSEMQQNLTMEICSLRKSCIDASPHKIEDKNCASSSGNSKEESADIREMVLTGDVNGSGNTGNQKIGEEPLTKSSPSQEYTDNAVSPRLNNNELVECQDRNTTLPDARDICPPIEFQKGKEKSSAKICLSKKKNTAELEQAVASAVLANDTVDEPIHVGAAQSTITPSFQVEEHDGSSMDSDEISVGSIDRRHQNDDSNGLPRRKIRKVRLLADLMNKKDSLDNDHIREDHTSSNAMATTSVGVRPGVAPEAQAFSEDVEKDKQSPLTKRKHCDEDSHSLVIRGITNVSKKARSSRMIPERPHMTSEVSNSETEGSHRSKHNNDRLPSSWKKKTPIQINDDQAVRTIHADSTPVNTSDVASTACRRAENEKCSSLFKGKRPEVENGETSTSTANYSILGEVPIQVNRTEIMRSGSSRNHFLSENDASTKVGLDLSLGRPLSSEQTATDNISMTAALFLQQKERPGRYLNWKDKNLVGDLNLLNNPSPSQSVRKGLPWDLNKKIGHNTGITLEKQKYSAVFENRGSTWQGKMDFSGPSLKGKYVESKGHMEASKRHSDQRAKKPYQQGLSDDIPMDIVELMARNQLERQLAGGEGDYQSKRTDNTITGSVNAQGNGPANWWRTETPGIANMPNSNASNGIGVPVTNRVASSSHGINFAHPEQSQMRLSHLDADKCKMFSAFSGKQQMLSSSIQFPVSGSSITGSRPSEGAKPVWLSNNENMPFGLSISQKYSTPSNNIETNARWTETQHKGRTISDIKAEEMKMQNKSQPILSKSGRGELHAGLRVSLDLHSNETIPAMQLLSLMNNGMPSNAASNADASRFAGKPYFPCGFHPCLSTDERGSFFNRSVLLHQHQGPGVHSAGESSTRPSSSVYNQMPFRSLEMEDLRNRAPPVQLSKAHNSFPKRGGLGISQPPCPGKDKLILGKQKGHADTSDFGKILLHCGRIDKSTTFIDLEANSVPGTACPSGESLEVGECHFNRNPAEFSVPEPGNEYTISGEGLEVLKYSFYRERSYAVSLDGRKRQRPTKVTTGKEHARHRTS